MRNLQSLENNIELTLVLQKDCPLLPHDLKVFSHSLCDHSDRHNAEG